MTDPDKYFNGFFNGGNPTGIVFRCDVKIADLSRFRFVTTDGGRNRFFFDFVGWKGGERVTLVEGLRIDRPFQPKGFCFYDLDFAEGTVPKDLDAIGIVERYYETPWKNYSPRYLRLSGVSR